MDPSKKKDAKPLSAINNAEGGANGTVGPSGTNPSCQETVPNSIRSATGEQDENIDASQFKYFQDEEDPNVELIAVQGPQPLNEILGDGEEIGEDGTDPCSGYKFCQIGLSKFLIDNDEFIQMFLAVEGDDLGYCPEGFGTYFSQKNPLNRVTRHCNTMAMNVTNLAGACDAIIYAKGLGVTKLCIHTTSEYLLKQQWKLESYLTPDGRKVRLYKYYKALDDALEAEDLKLKFVNAIDNFIFSSYAMQTLQTLAAEDIAKNDNSYALKAANDPNDRGSRKRRLN